MYLVSWWLTTDWECGPGCQDMSGHKDDWKFLQSSLGCDSNIVSFKTLGFHFQHQKGSAISTVFLKNDCFHMYASDKTWRSVWAALVSPPNYISYKIRIISNRPVPVDAFSIFTSMSLSNMWASGRKEMRQSSWFGKITFCKKVIEEREVKRWIYKKKLKGKSNAATVWRGFPRRSHLSLWEILRSRQPRFHVWAWLPLGFLCDDTQMKLVSDQQPNVATEPEKNMMGY